MNAGLPQGFVRFGTVAHMILLHIHEVGMSSHGSIVEDLGIEPREVGMNLARLHRHGFTISLGRLEGYQYSCRTQRAYAIVGSDMRRFPSFKNKTVAERTRHYRALKKQNDLKATSVFNFRGVNK